jgi:hypothetical protein
MKRDFSGQIFEKEKHKYKNPSSGSRVVAYERTDRPT